MRSKLVSLHNLTWPNLSKNVPLQQTDESLPSGTITLGLDYDLSECNSTYTKCIREGCDACRGHDQYTQLDWIDRTFVTDNCIIYTSNTPLSKI